MFDSELKYKKGFTNVEAGMLSRNLIFHFDLFLISNRPISLLVVKILVVFISSEIIEMQEKDNVRSKNYKTENGIIIIKKKRFRKIVLIYLRKILLDLTHENFGHPSIQ